MNIDILIVISIAIIVSFCISFYVSSRISKISLPNLEQQKQPEPGFYPLFCIDYFSECKFSLSFLNNPEFTEIRYLSCIEPRKVEVYWFGGKPTIKKIPQAKAGIEYDVEKLPSQKSIHSEESKPVTMVEFGKKITIYLFDDHLRPHNIKKDFIVIGILFGILFSFLCCPIALFIMDHVIN